MIELHNIYPCIFYQTIYKIVQNKRRFHVLSMENVGFLSLKTDITIVNKCVKKIKIRNT